MKLTELTEKIHDLQSLPSVALQINNEVKKESLTSKTLAAIISNDPPLAAKILKLANSSFYGLARQVDTLDRAVTVLGLNTIKNVALTLSVCSIFKKNAANPSIDIEGLWRHSIASGAAATILINNSRPTEKEKAFLGGIIHDIGAITLIMAFPEESRLVFKKIQEAGMSQTAAEQEVLGFSHQEAGAFFAEKWHFPQEIIDAIKFHHADYTQDDLKKISNKKLVFSVYAANNIVKVMGLGKSIDSEVGTIPKFIWKELNISEEVIPSLRAAIKDEYDLAANHFTGEGCC